MKRLIASAIAMLSIVGGLAMSSAPAAHAVDPPPLVVIFMENAERSVIESSADADYFKSFEAAGRTFIHYNGVSHPSLPNYLAFASGSTQGKDGNDSVNAGEIVSANIFGQLQGANITWNVFEETYPSACSGVQSNGTAPNQYVIRHNPAIVFDNIWTKPARCQKVVPYSNLNPSALPQLSFITPNLCDDIHSCPIATGDNWLASEVPPLLAAGAEVLITFDEGDSDTGGGGNVYTAVVGPGINAGNTRSSTFNHYNLLAGIEDRFGVTRLNNAVGATPLPI